MFGELKKKKGKIQWLTFTSKGRDVNLPGLNNT